MKSEKGFSLIEILVSLVLLSMIAVAFLSALATSSMATLIVDERTTAINLAGNQMESIKSQLYDSINNPPQYYQLSSIPDSSYTINITAERLDPYGDGTGNDDGIQKITVTIKHDDKVVTTLECYKVNR